MVYVAIILPVSLLMGYLMVVVCPIRISVKSWLTCSAIMFSVLTIAHIIS